MIVDCVSDLHGHYPTLKGGDLLIVAGDVTNNDYDPPFVFWIEQQSYEKIIWIAGNHDNIWYRSWLEHREKRRPREKEGKWKGPERDDKIEYLCDNGTIFKGLRIWGSPWTKTFKGMNPKCKAFTVDTEEELSQKWDKIPKNTDILICHSPFIHMLDANDEGYACGSSSLRDQIDRVKPKLFVSGHIHEQGGKTMIYKHQGPNTICVNASHVNEYYKPVNKPVRVQL